MAAYAGINQQQLRVTGCFAFSLSPGKTDNEYSFNKYTFVFHKLFNHDSEKHFH